jgi:hypothetical protein
VGGVVVGDEEDARVEGGPPVLPGERKFEIFRFHGRECKGKGEKFPVDFLKNGV